MQDWDDNALLREYVAHDSGAAFAELVARHVNKVYSVALRHTRNASSAEEITQAVFVILAKKSRRLSKGVVVSGWLYQTARLTALTYIRSEIRRAHREKEAYMQTLANETGPEVWPQIAPLLDAAMAGLSEADRHAVVLRYFDGKSMREVGAALGGSEDAAKVRVGRAVEKLRAFFTKRGVVVSGAALTAAVSANSVQAAPAALAKTATTIAIAKGATASASTTTLIKGTTKFIAWTNAKVAIGVGVAVLAVGTSATLMVQSEPKAAVTLPRSTWAFAGYGDPESTMKTLMWAMSRNDGKGIAACLSPDCLEEFEQLATLAKPPMSMPQFLVRVWNKKTSAATEIRILKSETIFEDEVVLNVSGKIEGNSGDTWIKLRKIGDEWKCDDFDARPKDSPARANGRSGMLAPNPRFGGVGLALKLDEASHEIRINGVAPNSPAAEAGLSTGLAVNAIDGVSTAKKSASECVFLTRGLVGKTVLLELADADRKATNKVELKRKWGMP